MNKIYFYEVEKYVHIHDLFQTELPLESSSEEPNYLENEVDDSLDTKDDKNDWYYEDCTMQEYEVMKVKNY